MNNGLWHNGEDPGVRVILSTEGCVLRDTLLNWCFHTSACQRVVLMTRDASHWMILTGYFVTIISVKRSKQRLCCQCEVRNVKFYLSLDSGPTTLRAFHNNVVVRSSNKVLEYIHDSNPVYRHPSDMTYTYEGYITYCFWIALTVCVSSFINVLKYLWNCLVKYNLLRWPSWRNLNQIDR